MNIEGRIRIRFRGDWHVGTGLGRSGDLDRLIARESVVLFSAGEERALIAPVVPAKTITGVLRDSAERLAAGLDASPSPGTARRSGSWSTLVDWLFGTSPAEADSAVAEAPRSACLSIRPGRLGRDDLTRLAAEPASFFSERSFTALTDDGVARDRSLRRIEVGTANTCFDAPVRLSTPALVDDNDLRSAWSFLIVSATLVESLGAHRRRGLGACDVELARVDDPDAPASVLADSITWLESAEAPDLLVDRDTSGTDERSVASAAGGSVRFEIDVTCETPVLAAPRVAGNVVRGVDHLPGRALLPLVCERLRTCGIPADQLVGEGRLRVSNGNPIAQAGDQEYRTEPIPFAFSRLKVAIPEPETHRVWNTLLGPPPAQAKQVRSGFVVTGDATSQTLTKVDTTMEVRAHNVISDEAQRPSAEVGGVFTYEAIAAGTRFRAFLDLDVDLDVDKRAAVAETLTGEASIGTSRKDDYGHVTLTGRVLNEPSSQENSSGIAKDVGFLVWCTAPAVLVDPVTLRPQPTTGAFADAFSRGLSDVLGRAVAVSTSAITKTGLHGEVSTEARIRTVRLDGFHRRWGLAQPTLPVIAAGSVLWLTSDTELSAAEVAELERRGVGLRTAEGFGRVRINPPELTIESYPDLASQPAPSGRRVEVEHLPRSSVDTGFAHLNPKKLMKQLGVPLSKAKVPLPGKLGELRAQLRRSGKGPGDHPACEWFKGSSSSRSKEARWGASLDPIGRLLNGRFDDQGSVWQLLNLQDPDSLSGDQWVSAVISVLDAVSRSRTRLEESSGKS